MSRNHWVYALAVVGLAGWGAILMTPQSVRADAATVPVATTTGTPPPAAVLQGAAPVAPTGLSCPGSTAASTALKTQLKSLYDLIKSKGKGSTTATACTQTSTGSGCPLNAAVKKDDLSCTVLEKTDGTVDPVLVAAFQSKVACSDYSVKCQQGVLDGVSSQLTCLTNAAQQLKDYMSKLGAYITGNIGAIKQTVTQYNTAIDDRDAQLKDIQSRLNGNQATGEPGLLKLKDAADAAIQELPAAIQAINDPQNQLIQNIKIMAEQVQQDMTSEAKKCFETTTDAVNFKCGDAGSAAPSAPTTLKDYILCRYRQNQLIDINGNIPKDPDENAKARATKNSAALSAVLDSIFTGISSTSQVQAAVASGGTGADQAQADSTINVFSAADVEGRYGKKLEGFNGKGLNIHDFTMSWMGTCFQQASKTIETRKTNASSSIGRLEFSLQDSQRKSATAMQGFLSHYSTQYNQIMTGLTGINIPMDTSKCAGASQSCADALNSSQDPSQLLVSCAQSQSAIASCTADMQTNIANLVTGVGTQYAMNMTIKGNTAASTVKFQCEGLAGCVTSLQSWNRFAEGDKARLTSEKTSYITNQNQNILTQFRSAASQLNAASAALVKTLNDMRTALTGIGVSGDIADKRLETDDPEYETEKDGSQGLIKNPKSMVKLINGMMEPKLLDLDGGVIGDVNKAIAAGKKDLADKSADAITADTVTGKAAQCTTDAKKAADKLVSGLRREIENIKQCQLAELPCLDAGGALEQLVTSIGDLTDAPGITKSAVDSLSGTAKTTCEGKVGSHINSAASAKTAAATKVILELPICNKETNRTDWGWESTTVECPRPADTVSKTDATWTTYKQCVQCAKKYQSLSQTYDDAYTACSAAYTSAKGKLDDIKDAATAPNASDAK